MRAATGIMCEIGEYVIVIGREEEGRIMMHAGPTNPNEEGTGRFEKVCGLQLRPISIVFPQDGCMCSWGRIRSFCVYEKTCT